MAINFTPTITELIDLVEDWSVHPQVLKDDLVPEAQAIFPSLIVNEIENLVDAFISGGATADEAEAFFIDVVAGTTANIETIAKILNHAAATGSASTISNINSAVNAVYGTVVLDQIANDAKDDVEAALLIVTTNFAAIGNAIGVASATAIKDELDSAITRLDTLIALL